MSSYSKTGDYFVGVDVGTGSVRAALVTKDGKVLEVYTEDTRTWNPKPDFFEQSSDNIWEACCTVIKNVVRNVDPSSIKGIGFDATCSLVAVDSNGKPVTISPTGEDEQNVVLWMDHRALAQADLINSKNNSVLRYVGGKVSLEMETPKLLWLKQNLKEKCWNRVGYFFDLPDFLTWKASGSDSRSLCSLVCKWTYEADPEGNMGWSEKYFKEIGLEDLMKNNWKKIGSDVKSPGEPCGTGLTEEAANAMGLVAGTAVGTSLIDAHAGGLGMLGCSAPNISDEFHTRLGLISGTSTCHMAVSKNPMFVDGVWGPYFSAMAPGMWLNEGGQSATGKLIDHIIDIHPATGEINEKIAGDMHIQQYLNDLLKKMAAKQGYACVSYLTLDVHVWPDFHGNRSPIADPNLRGMISGLTLSCDEEQLAVLYLATIQALSYGTQHIIQVLQNAGHSLKSVLICGGLSRNPLFVQTQADVIGLPVLCPREPESVLVGSAILGAYAAGVFSSVDEAIKSMGGEADVIHPTPEGMRYHQKKYLVFLKMLEDQRQYAKLMQGCKC